MFQQLQQLHRHSRRGSNSSCSSDEHHAGLDFSSRRQSSATSERTCENLTADRTRDLWKCMLELQEQYGCYHSARIDIAMDAGEEAVKYMPTRFIIDILNNSVVDFLPEEGWEKLSQHLEQRDSVPKQSK